MPDLFTNNPYVEHPEKNTSETQEIDLTVDEAVMMQSQVMGRLGLNQKAMIALLYFVCGMSFLGVLATILTTSGNFTFHVSVLPLEVAGGAIIAVAILAKVKGILAAVALGVVAVFAVGFLIHPIGATQVTRTVTVCSHIPLQSQSPATATTHRVSSSTTLTNSQKVTNEYRIKTSSGEFKLDNPVIDPVKGLATAPTPSAQAYPLVADHATYRATYWGVRGPVVFGKFSLGNRVPGMHQLVRITEVNQIQLDECRQQPKVA